MCTSDGDSRSNLNVILIHGFFEQPRSQVTVRIHSHDLLLVGPLREGSDLCSGFSVREVRFVGDVEVLACYSKGVVDGVGASMSTDS